MLKYTNIPSYVCSFAAHTWLPGRNCYEIGTTIRAHIAPHIKWQVEWINFITFALRAPQSKTTQGKSYQINLNQLNSAFIQTLGETSLHDATTARTVVRRGKARWLRQVEARTSHRRMSASALEQRCRVIEWLLMQIWQRTATVNDNNKSNSGSTKTIIA